jgi:nicotinate-nucleotide adenylyltransferase
MPLDPQEAGPRAFGILGGTFDPIHLGHLALARTAHAALDLDRVLFVPNGHPPHKRDQVITSAEHREAMVALAIDGEPGFVLSRLELERPGPSYAVDTVAELAELARAEGRPEPWFILSAETLDGLVDWREPERILELCRIAVGSRPGAASLDPAWLAHHHPGREDRFTFLPGPLPDVASTTIRDRAGRGLAIRGLVPPSVERYIVEHGLYGPEGGQVDPRSSATPGLPGRRRARGGDGPRPVALPAAVDEAVLRLAHRAVELAADKKAFDIVLLDVRGQTTMTDYFVICSGGSERQLGAIADGIVEGLRAEGQRPLSREGAASSHWILVDFGGLIVHVMSVPERDFYQLERLWSKAALLVRIV